MSGSIGGSRGGVRDARPPLGVQILSISCSFRENLACSRPPWRVHAPPSGKSWIRHWVGNAINSVHTHAFRGLTNLQFLSLRDNAIANFNYGTFDHVPKLEHMILSTNTFVTINKEMFKGNCSLMNLKYLDLSNNYRLHSIEDGAFSHLSNLVRLYLHDNSFFFLCPEIFQGLISLKEITFYYTMDDPYHMNMTGNTFIQLKKLTNLDFEGNNIRHLYHNTLHGLF